VLAKGYLGQTAGKMAVGIKVVAEATGQAPGIAAAIRRLLRIVDGLFSYLVAFVTVLVSDKRQRLGDMAARTLVVKVWQRPASRPRRPAPATADAERAGRILRWSSCHLPPGSVPHRLRRSW
jgi:uncharacterized RDD family membrane protein YckC